MSLEHVQESSVSTAGRVADGIARTMISGIESAARVTVGQVLLKMADRLLWIIEKSAQWSLPIQEIAAEENGKTFGKMELVRPLPWILFLPGLVILRVIRAGINIGAFLFGYPKVLPSGLVRFIQKGRRRLQAIKTNGLKDMHQQKSSSTKDEELSEAKKSLIKSILVALSTLSCLDLDGSKRTPSPPPTRIHVRNDTEAIRTPEEIATLEQSVTSTPKQAKQIYSNVSSKDLDYSEGESLQSKIKRLVLENSAEDPDFNPIDCSISEESSLSNDEEENVSISEVRAITEDAILAFSHASKTAEIINEEPELSKEHPPQQEVNRVHIPQSVTSEETEYKESEPEIEKSYEEQQTNNQISKDNVGSDDETTFLTPINTTKNQIINQESGSDEESANFTPISSTNSQIAQKTSNLGEETASVPTIGLTNRQTSNKIGSDGETAFFSPISSASGTPERSVSPVGSDHIQPERDSVSSLKDSDNVDSNLNDNPSVTSTSGNIGLSTLDEKRGTVSGKAHHRGKRINHGNRKKK